MPMTYVGLNFVIEIPAPIGGWLANFGPRHQAEVRVGCGEPIRIDQRMRVRTDTTIDPVHKHLYF